MKHDTDDQILTADRNAWRKRAIELHKAARAYMQVADAILVRMRYRDDPTYDSAALDLGDLLNDRQSAIGAALVAKHGPVFTTDQPSSAEVAPKPGVCRHCGQYLDRRGKCRNPEHNS